MEIELGVVQCEARAVRLRIDWPKSFGISPMPTAPAATSLRAAPPRAAPIRSHVLKVIPVTRVPGPSSPGCIDCRDGPLELVTEDVVRHTHHADVKTVEVRTEPRERTLRSQHPLRMPVEIDRRVAGLLNEVRRRDQSRSRPIVEYARRSLLRAMRCEVEPPSCRWTGLTWLDRRRAFRRGLRGESDAQGMPFQGRRETWYESDR